MKTFFATFFILSLVWAGNTAAQETETSVEAVVEAEAITAADLGVGEPRLLPTSPFYFIKEISRGLQRVFAFDSVAKTELELKIASEKAAEAAKVAEGDPEDERGISRALMNYERAQERLRVRLGSLGETSENPNVDRLLDIVAERQIAHEKLLEGLEAKHDTQKSIIQNIRARVQGTFGEIAEKDTAEKFQERLENAFESARGSTLKHVRSLEILDRLRENDQIPEQARDRLQQVRDRLSEEARENIEEFTEEGEEGANRLRDALQKIPGDSLKRTVILEEIRARATERAANALDEARNALDKAAQERFDFEEEARLQIVRTEEYIAKIEARLQELGDEAPQASRALLEQAKQHVEGAKTAFAEGNFRNAFGLSRAAEAIAQNILRLFGDTQERLEDFPELLQRIRDRIKEPSDISIPRAFPDDNTQIACTMEYAPVCGMDGKTYSNRCVAERQNRVRVQYEGECRDEAAEGRKYHSRGTCDISPNELIVCEDGYRWFHDDTGCGCEVRPPAAVPAPPARPTPVPTPVPPPPPAGGSVTPAVRAVTIESDDSSFSPSEIRVAKGTKVVITFNVSTSNVYFGGLDFRSSKFTTPQILPGNSTTVEFVADESFEFKSYWPASNVLKATGRVIVE